MAKPGTKPKPTELKRLTGNPGGRKLRSKPKLDNSAIPDPPDHLDLTAKKEWRRVAPQLHRAGLLYQVDAAALSAYCMAYSRWVQAEKKLQKNGLIELSPKGYPIQNPYLAIANKAMEQIRRFLTEFGMTPSSRDRFDIKSDDDDNPWASL